MNSDSSENGLLSIIVSTYKRYDFLEKTLDSLRGQTYRDIEILVVSDGKDSQSESVVNATSDSRVRYLFTPHAGFPAVPRNGGLRHAQGQWLAFCDDDDLWHPEKVSRQLPVLLDGQYSFCTSDYDYIDQYDQPLKVTNHYEPYFGRFDWRTFYHSMGFICNAAVVFNRELHETIGFLNEDPDLKAHEDFEYWMRMLFQRDAFMLDQKLVSYRVHGGSIQVQKPWQTYQRRRALHRILHQVLPIPLQDRARKSIKTAIHLAFDQFPPLKRGFRRLQGHHDDARAHD